MGLRDENLTRSGMTSWLDGPVLSDGDLVRNLLGLYCERIDAGDFDGAGALFAGGHLATEDGRVLATGAAEVAAFYRGGTRLHGATPRTKHLVIDTVLEPSGPDAMVARSSYLVLQAIDDALALQPIITGRYVDTFDRGGDRDWRWTERRFTVDLIGDVSHHLGFAL